MYSCMITTLLWLSQPPYLCIHALFGHVKKKVHGQSVALLMYSCIWSNTGFKQKAVSGELTNIQLQESNEIDKVSIKETSETDFKLGTLK